VRGGFSQNGPAITVWPGSVGRSSIVAQSCPPNMNFHPRYLGTAIAFNGWERMTASNGEGQTSRASRCQTPVSGTDSLSRTSFPNGNESEQELKSGPFDTWNPRRSCPMTGPPRCARVGELKTNDSWRQQSVADWRSLKLRQPLANIRIVGEVKSVGKE
jgi:hypothetical protein